MKLAATSQPLRVLHLQHDQTLNSTHNNHKSFALLSDTDILLGNTHIHTQKGDNTREREKPQKCQTLNHYLNTKHSHLPHLPFFWGISEDLLKLCILQSRVFRLDVGSSVENSLTDCIVLTEVQYRQCTAKCTGVGQGGLWCELPFIPVQWLREKGDQFVPPQSAATSLVTEIKALPHVEREQPLSREKEKQNPAHMLKWGQTLGSPEECLFKTFLYEYFKTNQTH